ncbi:hypothetical protein FRC16_007310 [Serendipita sp. 398]|nr:hypothetical protein FRC16_007310 [Serendipita sp. 398]
MTSHPSEHPETKDPEDPSKTSTGRNDGQLSTTKNEVKGGINSANDRLHQGLDETNVHNNKDPFLKTGRNVGINKNGGIQFQIDQRKKKIDLEKEEPKPTENKEDVQKNPDDSQINPLNNDPEDPNHNNHNNNNNRREEENRPQDQVVEVQPGTNQDKLCCKCLTDAWEFVFPSARADLHIARTITYVTGLYGTINAFWMASGHQHMGPEVWDIGSVAIGLASGGYVVARTNTIPWVLKKIRERRARGQAPIPPIQNPRQGVANTQGGQPFGPKIDYWRMMKELATELEKQGAKGITHDTVINYIMGELRAIGVDIPREEVAKADVEDMFNHVVAWYDATEPEFWSQCRPEVQGDGMDKDSVVAQLAVIHIYKDMCRFSEELAPDNAWISPKAEEETTLREQLVETYKSSVSDLPSYDRWQKF